MKKITSLVAFLVGASMLVIGCGGGSSTSPTPPLAPGVTMAPPPAGVSSAVWRIGFADNGRLYRPDAVHLDMSSFDQNTRSIFAEMLQVATDSIQGKTPLDMIPGGVGATFPVTLAPGFTCGGYGHTAGCTTLATDNAGKITGGKMEWASLVAMQDKPGVLHEIMRTLGVIGVSPVSGLMSLTPWSQPRPSDEERLMLLGRYTYPLLAQYTP